MLSIESDHLCPSWLQAAIINTPHMGGCRIANVWLEYSRKGRLFAFHSIMWSGLFKIPHTRRLIDVLNATATESKK